MICYNILKYQKMLHCVKMYIVNMFLMQNNYVMFYEDIVKLLNVANNLRIVLKSVILNAVQSGLNMWHTCMVLQAMLSFCGKNRARLDKALCLK